MLLALFYHNKPTTHPLVSLWNHFSWPRAGSETGKTGSKLALAQNWTWNLAKWVKEAGGSYSVRWYEWNRSLDLWKDLV